MREGHGAGAEKTGPRRTSRAVGGRLKRPLIALVAIAVTAVMGCSDVFRPSYKYSTVTVTASDLDGEPVPGVRLTLYTGSMHMSYGVTGTNGRYVFAFVPAGGYGVEAGPPDGYRWPGGADTYRIIDVEQGEAYAAEFRFERQP